MIVTQICACGILMQSGRARALQYAGRDVRICSGALMQRIRGAGRGARETTADAPVQLHRLYRINAYLRVYAVAGGYCTGGVMATCAPVDSYCFVIGPCDDAFGPPRRRISLRRSFYWKFPAAHFSISAIFPFAGVTTRAGDFSTFAFSRRVLFFPLFCVLFFCFFFLFSRAVPCKIRGFRVNPSLLLNQSS